MTQKSFVEEMQARGIERGGDFSSIAVDIQLPIDFLTKYLLIYQAYAPFLVNNGRYQGPTQKDIKFLAGNVGQTRSGTKLFHRTGTVNIQDAWTDIMLAANHYFWPNGTLIRDYLVVLCKAVEFWGFEEANKNRNLLKCFQNLLNILKLSEVPAFDSYQNLHSWLLGSSCPLMVALPRHSEYADLKLPIDTARTVFHKLDSEVMAHCSQSRIKAGAEDITALAKEVVGKDAQGLGVFGYFFRGGQHEVAEQAPGDLFKHRYALIRVKKKDFDNKELTRALVRLAQLCMMSGLYEAWGSTTAIDTIEALKAASHRNSTAPLKDRAIVNEALDGLRGNPRTGVAQCIVEGVVFYGVVRLTLESVDEGPPKADKSPEPGPEGVDKPRQSAEERLVDKLKESRLTAADKEDGGTLFLPIVLLGVALFLVMK